MNVHGLGRLLLAFLPFQALELDELTMARSVFESRQARSWRPLLGTSPTPGGGEHGRSAYEPAENERARAGAPAFPVHGTIVRRCHALSSAHSATCSST